MAGAIPDVTSENWGTPFVFFQKLETRFGKFDLDAAAGLDWSMCDNFISKEMNALDPNTIWNGKNIFLNPPYGHWIPKFLARVLIEVTSFDKQIVCLLPAKTDTKWFHEVVFAQSTELLFVKGRLNFRLPGKINSATFPSIVVKFTPTLAQNQIISSIQNR